MRERERFKSQKGLLSFNSNQKFERKTTTTIAWQISHIPNNMPSKRLCPQHLPGSSRVYNIILAKSPPKEGGTQIFVAPHDGHVSGGVPPKFHSNRSRHGRENQP
jgi:hypothetical protein